ncbi:MAG: asparagine synthase (glutamine-hydrolyzing) [Candidatus Methanoperedens sp.]|nr:asparagine synthase (glutamine-hydrolyzing) [Candidatus Methanoperedens sp.]
MCAICGIFGASNEEAIHKMMEVMKPRGPDGMGVHIDADISLGVHRLSIVDSKNGDQPIFNETRETCILFNGEVYNYKPLREELVNNGHQFSTETDTEVVLHLFEEYGEQCVDLLKGMFAFAIWDGQKLFLARDRMGIKPLFYTFLPTEGLFIFGSEIKSIFQYDKVPRTINEKALCEQSVLGYILSSDLTLFEGIKQLCPGTTMSISKNRHKNKIDLCIKQYYRLKIPAPSNESAGDQEIKEMINLLQNELEETSKLFVSHSELPKGVLLSGGLDSSLLAILCAKHSPIPLHTFSVADSLEHLDLEYARKVSQFINSKHHEIIIDFDEFLNELPNFVLAYENLSRGGTFNPFGDFGFYLLSKRASKFVKVAICGEGADELFGGYWMHKYPVGYSGRLKENLESFNPSNPFVCELKEDLKKWFPDDINRELYAQNVLDFLLRSAETNYHLWAVDHGSMPHGLEVRVPYLYEDIVQMVIKFPSKVKIHNGTTKYILRKVADKYFEEKGLQNILSREKLALPSGFTNLSKKLASFCEMLIPDKYYNEHQFRQYLHSKVDVLMFDMLYKIFIDNGGKLPNGFRVNNIYQFEDIK